MFLQTYETSDRTGDASRPDEGMANALEMMAVAARRRNRHAAAAAALELAAALSWDDAFRVRRLNAAAVDAELAGQRVWASRFREMAITAGGGHTEAPAAERGRVELLTGDPAVAFRILRSSAAVAVTNGAAATEVITLLAGSAVAALVIGDPEGAMAEIARARQLLVEPAGSEARLVGLLHGLVQLARGQSCGGAQLLRTWSPPTSDRLPVEFLVLAAAGLSELGEHRRARDLLTPVIDDLRGAAALGVLPFALQTYALVEARSGNILVARAAAAEAVQLSLLMGSDFWTSRALGALAFVQAIAGEEDQCRRNVAEAIALRCDGTDNSSLAEDALVLLEMGLSRYQAAVASLKSTARLIKGAAGKCTVLTGPDELEARVRAGEPLPGAVATTSDLLLCENEFPLQMAIAWRLRGLTCQEKEIDRCFQQAIKLHLEVESPLDTARTHLAYGERLRRAGRRTQAREQLNLALGIFERIKADLWSQHARNELLAASPGPSRRGGGAQQLTPQEEQVARTVARGVSNREAASELFLSEKTVEFHLSNVYRKLGIRTRSQLVHRFAMQTHALTP